ETHRAVSPQAMVVIRKNECFIEAPVRSFQDRFEVASTLPEDAKKLCPLCQWVNSGVERLLTAASRGPGFGQKRAFGTECPKRAFETTRPLSDGPLHIGARPRSHPRMSQRYRRLPLTPPDYLVYRNGVHVVSTTYITLGRIKRAVPCSQVHATV